MVAHDSASKKSVTVRFSVMREKLVCESVPLHVSLVQDLLFSNYLDEKLRIIRSDGKGNIRPFQDNTGQQGKQIKCTWCQS